VRRAGALLLVAALACAGACASARASTPPVIAREQALALASGLRPADLGAGWSDEEPHGSPELAALGSLSHDGSILGACTRGGSLPTRAELAVVLTAASVSAFGSARGEVSSAVLLARSAGLARQEFGGLRSGLGGCLGHVLLAALGRGALAVQRSDAPLGLATGAPLSAARRLVVRDGAQGSLLVYLDTVVESASRGVAATVFVGLGGPAPAALELRLARLLATRLAAIPAGD